MVKLRKPTDPPMLMERVAFADEVLEILAGTGDFGDRLDDIAAAAEKHGLAIQNEDIEDESSPLILPKPAVAPPADLPTDADEPPADEQPAASARPEADQAPAAAAPPKKGKGR